MAVVQHGTDVLVGAPTLTGYYVQEWNVGDNSADVWKVKDETGAQVNETVPEIQVVISFTAIPKSGNANTPEEHFPKYLACTLSPYTTYIVDAFSRNEKAEPHTISVTLRKPNFTL